MKSAEIHTDSLFDAKDYRTYLKTALPTCGANRGQRTSLAHELRVQKGWISAVINGSAELSLEHAFRVSQFLSHSEDERGYFLLLVQHSRAGSKDLQDHFSKKILEIQSRRRELTERIRTKVKLSEMSQTTYYSSWHYTAVHMCLMIEKLRTPTSVADYLKLPIARVKAVLEFLFSNGLAELKDGHYYASPTRIHLASNSDFISKHHTNWRMKAIQSLDLVKKEDLHYSSVMSLSKETAEKIRALLLQSIQSTEPLIRDAKDEDVYVLTIDWFGLR